METQITGTAFVELSLKKANKVDSKLKELNQKMDAEIFLARQKYIDDISALQKEKDNITVALTEFGFKNLWFFEGTKKSFTTPFGTIGLRSGKPKLALLPDFTWDLVTENLKALFPAYLRVHVEPAKDKLLADHLYTEVADSFDEIGLCVVKEDSIYVDLNKKA